MRETKHQRISTRKSEYPKIRGLWIAYQIRKIDKRILERRDWLYGRGGYYG